MGIPGIVADNLSRKMDGPWFNRDQDRRQGDGTISGFITFM